MRTDSENLLLNELLIMLISQLMCVMSKYFFNDVLIGLTVILLTHLQTKFFGSLEITVNYYSKCYLITPL